MFRSPPRRAFASLLASVACGLTVASGAWAHGDDGLDGLAHAKRDLAAVSVPALERRSDPSAGLAPRSTRARRAESTDPGETGSFGAIQAMPVVPVYSALLPSGKVLLWDSISDRPAESEPLHIATRAAVWDPATGTSRRVDVYGTNIFCSGFAHLPNGNILVVGGNADFMLNGSRATHVFDWRTETWSQGPDLAQGRWYPSVAAQSDGSSLVIGGGPTISELVRSSGPRLDIQQFGGLDTPSSRLYPYMQVDSTGATQYSNEHATASELSIAADGSVRTPGDPSVAFGDYGSYGSYAVGKTLYAGGSPTAKADAAVVDTTSGEPRLERAEPMAHPRRQHTLTLLADGSSVVTGGLSTTGIVDLDHAVYQAERWDPDTARWTGLASAAVARQYHSSALLLPDGRVLTGGGGICSPCVLAGYLRRDAEIFTPPYLYRHDGSGRLADRPSIASAPVATGYATTFSAQIQGGTGEIAKVGLVKLGAATHGHDQDQRYVPLTFTQDGRSLAVASPRNPFEAPPGPYMLFAVDDAGVPSVAKIVQVAAPTVVSPSPARANLARAAGVRATGSLPCTPFDTAARAFDGRTSTRWCSWAPAQRLELDLGTVRAADTVVVRHAQTGGDGADHNTKAFTISVSTDKRTWTSVGRATGNASAVTTHRFAARPVRYVRLDVTAATQGIDPFARITELEVLAPSPLTVPVGSGDLGGAVALYPGPGLTGDPQRLWTGEYDAARGNLGTAGPRAASVDVAAGYRAQLCDESGQCVDLTAGRYPSIPVGLAGSLATVRASPLT